MKVSLANKPFKKIILVNGWNAPKLLWQSVDGFWVDKSENLVLIDPSDYVSLENCLHEIRGQLEEQTLLVGWSLGAQLLLEFLQQLELTERNKVSGFIALQASLKFVAEAGWEFGIDEHDFGRLVDLTKSERLKELNRQFSFLVTSGGRNAKEDLRTFKSAYTANEQRPGLVSALQWLQEIDAREYMPALKLPTFWCFGAQDMLVDKRQVDLLTQIPHVTCEVVEGIGHFPFGSNWLVIEPKINAFIDTL